MSKYYQNKKTGLHFISGTVKSVADNKMSVTISAFTWDVAAKKNVPVDVTVSMENPADFRIGAKISALGFPRGSNKIFAEKIMTGNSYAELENLSFISGKVKRAEFRDEKNADGTPRLKADGVTPKKPHFDITIAVKDPETEKWTDHIVSTYNTKFDDKAIDKMEKRFERFKDKSVKAAIVTVPGNEFVSKFTGEDGVERESYRVYHLGCKSLDLEEIDEPAKSHDTVDAEQSEEKQTDTEKTEDLPLDENKDSNDTLTAEEVEEDIDATFGL